MRGRRCLVIIFIRFPESRAILIILYSIYCVPVNCKRPKETVA